LKSAFFIILCYVLWCNRVLKSHNVSLRGCCELNTDKLTLSCLGCHESFLNITDVFDYLRFNFKTQVN